MGRLVHRTIHCAEERRSQICMLQENVEFMLCFVIDNALKSAKPDSV